MKLKPTKSIAKQVEADLNSRQHSASGSLLSSDSSLNVTENVADFLPDYSELDEFTRNADAASESSETSSEEKSELASENSQVMSDEDAFIFAAGSVGYLESLASGYVGTDVSIPDEQKEDVAKKGAIVIKKYFGGAELPPWLKKYKEELDFGLALGACVFSVYRQKKLFDAEQEVSKLKAEIVPTEKVNYDLSMSGVASAD